MGRDAAIAIVVLAEIILVLLALLGVLAWRLRLARSQAAPMTSPEAGRLWLDDNLRDTGERPAAFGAAAPRRLSHLEAERQALELEAQEDRDALLREAYSPPEPTPDDGEKQRLRRLLQREESRLAQLLTLRDELKDLRVRYDRVRRLAERLAEGSVGEAQRSQVADTYQKLEAEWISRLGMLEESFGEATAELELPSTPEAGEQTEASATTEAATNTRALLENQTETLARLRQRLGADGGEAAAELEQLSGQIGEFEVCVQILEAENRQLADRVAEFEAGAASMTELEQALAMKDREINELREQLGGGVRPD